MALNGRLPASALAPIPGGRLAKAAALRWNAMCAHQRKRGRRVPMPNGPLSSYRDLAGQRLMRSQWCARGACGNAAVPGRSNHGIGISVDTNDGAIVDSLPQFGFHRRHSDAPWESWHRTWSRRGSTSGGAQFGYTLVTIRKGTKGAAVKHLQVLLRGAGYLRLNWRAHTKYTLTVRRAVREFQRNNNMKVDGIVGPATWSALRGAYDRKR